MNNILVSWKKSSLTQPNPMRKDLEGLLKTKATIVNYPAKKIFLEPGDCLDGIYYIASGRTKHYMIGLDGTEKVLYSLSSGWFYGEAPCFIDEPTGLYSMTEEKTILYKIPISVYQDLIDNNKLFRDAIFYSYSAKVLIMRHEIENLAFNSCKDRIKRLFCLSADTSRLIENSWYNLNIHYTQYELSTIVGGARVTVSKLINELCQEGFVRSLNHKIQVNAMEYEKFMKWIDEHRY